MQNALSMGTTNATPNLRTGGPSFSTTLTQNLTPEKNIPGHGIRSNLVINYHYLVASNSIAEQSVSAGQLVFIYKKQSKIRPLIKQHNLLNIPMLNYFLMADAEKAVPKYQSVFDILDNFQLQGVVVNAWGGGKEMQHSGRGTASKQSKIINLNVSGHTSTLNLWGNVIDGEKLYLTIVKQKLLAGTRFTFNVGASEVLQKTTECYQIVPTKKPWFFIEDFQNSTDCASICLGRVYRSKRMTSLQPPSSRILQDTIKMKNTCENIEILLNIEHPSVTFS